MNMMNDDDPWDVPSIGRPLIELLTETLDIRENLHDWLPSGMTLLAGKSKSGKSTLAEQIAEELSLSSGSCTSHLNITSELHRHGLIVSHHIITFRSS